MMMRIMSENEEEKEAEADQAEAKGPFYAAARRREEGKSPMM
jgi:hypothetical protein